jgi:hypothetical protein
MGPPPLGQIEIALQSRIHQRGTAALSNGRFHDRQRHLGDPQPLSFDYIRSRWWLVLGTVTSTMSGANRVRPCHHAAAIPLAAETDP